MSTRAERKRERRYRPFGVTVGLRAEHVDNVLAEGGKDGLKAATQDLAEQAVEELRKYVGGAPMRSDVAVNLDGPKDDPIQGPMYGLSVVALFDPDDLGVDSPARLLLMKDDGAGAVDVARSTEGEVL